MRHEINRGDALQKNMDVAAHHRLADPEDIHLDQKNLFVTSITQEMKASRGTRRVTILEVNGDRVKYTVEGDEHQTSHSVNAMTDQIVRATGYDQISPFGEIFLIKKNK